MGTVRDITRVLTAEGLTWSSAGRTLQEQFDAATAGARDGLYVFVFSNDSDQRVRDNNPKPKTVIGPSSASLKAGKFEQGFVQRLANYYDHLRREDEGGVVRHVFPECLRLALVLDLSPLEIGLSSPAKVFERYWTESIDLFLERRDLMGAKQNWRAEWRNLQRSSLSDAELRDLGIFADGLALRIAKMAAVLSETGEAKIIER